MGYMEYIDMEDYGSNVQCKIRPKCCGPCLLDAFWTGLDFTIKVLFNVLSL
jgi:hypothetical protein